MRTMETSASQRGRGAGDCWSADPSAFPVSPGQQRLWFLEHFQPGTPLFNVSVAVRIEGELDSAAFSKAIREIVRRHEIREGLSRSR